MGWSELLRKSAEYARQVVEELTAALKPPNAGRPSYEPAYSRYRNRGLPNAQQRRRFSTNSIDYFQGNKGRAAPFIGSPEGCPLSFWMSKLEHWNDIWYMKRMMRMHFQREKRGPWFWQRELENMRDTWRDAYSGLYRDWRWDSHWHSHWRSRRWSDWQPQWHSQWKSQWQSRLPKQSSNFTGGEWKHETHWKSRTCNNHRGGGWRSRWDHSNRWHDAAQCWKAKARRFGKAWGSGFNYSRCRHGMKKDFRRRFHIVSLGCLVLLPLVKVAKLLKLLVFRRHLGRWPTPEELSGATRSLSLSVSGLATAIRLLYVGCGNQMNLQPQSVYLMKEGRSPFMMLKQSFMTRQISPHSKRRRSHNSSLVSYALGNLSPARHMSTLSSGPSLLSHSRELAKRPASSMSLNVSPQYSRVSESTEFGIASTIFSRSVFNIPESLSDVGQLEYVLSEVDILSAPPSISSNEARDLEDVDRLYNNASPPQAPSAAVDFYLIPRIPLSQGAALSEDTVDGIRAAISRQISQLQATLADIGRVSELGELPLTLEQNGSVLRVHFPNSDVERVAALTDDKGINTGSVVEISSSTPSETDSSSVYASSDEVLVAPPMPEEESLDGLWSELNYQVPGLTNSSVSGDRVSPSLITIE